eukprot:1680172-Lingulodinium_polyedra.AAC.1
MADACPTLLEVRKECDERVENYLKCKSYGLKSASFMQARGAVTEAVKEASARCVCCNETKFHAKAVNHFQLRRK